MPESGPRPTNKNYLLVTCVVICLIFIILFSLLLRRVEGSNPDTNNYYINFYNVYFNSCDNRYVPSSVFVRNYHLISNGCLTKVDNVIKDDFLMVDEFVAKDSENIFIKGKQLDNVDSDKFVKLNDNLYKNRSSIYQLINLSDFDPFNIDFQEIKNIDLETFEILSSNFFRDSNDIYYYSNDTVYSKLSNVETPTFGIIKFQYSKDSRNIFFRDRIIPDANPSEFRVVSQDLGHDDDTLFKEYSKVPFEPEPEILDPLDKITLNNFFRSTSTLTWEDFIDENLTYIIEEDKVYVRNRWYYKGNPILLKDVDLRTFKVIDLNGQPSNFASDRKNVYYYDQILEDESPRSFDINRYLGIEFEENVEETITQQSTDLDPFGINSTE